MYFLTELLLSAVLMCELYRMVMPCKINNHTKSQEQALCREYSINEAFYLLPYSGHQKLDYTYLHVGCQIQSSSLIKAE